MLALATALFSGRIVEPASAQQCVFEDTFERPAANTVDNGWQETESAADDVSLVVQNGYGFVELMGPGAAMVQPGIDTTHLHNLTLTYTFAYADVYNEYTDTLLVEWKPSSSGVWTLLLERKLNLGGARTDVVPLAGTASAGPIDIRFRVNVDEANEGAAIDDIYVCEGDCNSNGVADSSDIASGASTDCNGNNVPDDCDIAAGTSQDLDRNGAPDECICVRDADCDDGVFCNGPETCTPSGCETGSPPDCGDNDDATTDRCDTDLDLCVNEPAQIDCDDGAFCNGLEVFDETLGECLPGEDPCDEDETCDENADTCQPIITNDCNSNSVEDADDIAAGRSQDANHNGVPDECDPPTSPDPPGGGGCGAVSALNLTPLLLLFVAAHWRTPRRGAA